MNTAEWIIVAILSLTLFCFLVIGIILFLKLIDLTKDAKIVIKTGQDIAEKTEDVVDNAKGIAHNVRELTSISGIAKAISNRLERKGIEVELVDKTNSKKQSGKNAKTPEKTEKR